MAFCLVNTSVGGFVFFCLFLFPSDVPLKLAVGFRSMEPDARREPGGGGAATFAAASSLPPLTAPSPRQETFQ